MSVHNNGRSLHSCLDPPDPHQPSFPLKGHKHCFFSCYLCGNKKDCSLILLLLSLTIWSIFYSPPPPLCLSVSISISTSLFFFPVPFLPLQLTPVSRFFDSQFLSYLRSLTSPLPLGSIVPQPYCLFSPSPPLTPTAVVFRVLSLSSSSLSLFSVHLLFSSQFLSPRQAFSLSFSISPYSFLVRIFRFLFNWFFVHGVSCSVCSPSSRHFTPDVPYHHFSESLVDSLNVRFIFSHVLLLML